MNLQDLHQQEKEVSALALFKGELGVATAIQLNAQGKLKEHLTKSPALLLCVSGSVMYHDANDRKVALAAGDYVLITPDVKHWLVASEVSQLLLLK